MRQGYRLYETYGGVGLDSGVVNETVPSLEGSSEKYTSIRVRCSTVAAYRKYGAKGDSYDTILARVIGVLEDPSFSIHTKKRIRKALFPGY